MTQCLRDLPAPDVILGVYVNLTNNSNIVHSYKCTYSGQSAHNTVEVLIRLLQATRNNPNKKCPKKILPQFFNEDIDWKRTTRGFKEVDWTSKVQGLSVNAMFVKFLEIWLATASKLIPKRKQPHQARSRIPRHCRLPVRTRRWINKQLCQSPTDSHRKSLKTRLVEIERKLQQLYLEQPEAHDEWAVSNIKTNPKYFYLYAKSFFLNQDRCWPPPQLSKDVDINLRKMAEILSAQYASVFSQPRFTDKDLSGLFPDELQAPEENVDIPITEEEPMKAMSHVQPNSAAGPNGFPEMLLNKYTSTIAHPLFMICRDSLDSGIIPDTCKLDNITPIHKGKRRVVSKHYRPVALTSLLIKTVEKVVRRHLVNHLKVNDLFNTSQHGFLIGRSCPGQLLAQFDLVTRLKEEGKPVDVICLNFSKAFDKVDFGLTLRNLKSIGISGK